MARDRDARGSRGRGPLPDDALALLALPPDRFTKERDTLAARLASGGDAAGAAAVRRLRRPVGLAWLLNRVAQARPSDVDGLVAAGDRLRAGQRQAIAGGGAGALREAEEAVRGAARGLRTEARALAEEAGRAPDPAALARLELLLRLVAVAPGEARDALRRGALEREPELASGDLSGLAVVPGGAAARAQPPARHGAEAGAKPPSPAAARPPPDRAARRRGRDAEGRAKADRALVARETREREAAEERTRRATARREATERARAEREARARDRARAAASRALARAEGEAAAARRRLEAAEARVAEARARLDALGRS